MAVTSETSFLPHAGPLFPGRQTDTGDFPHLLKNKNPSRPQDIAFANLPPETLLPRVPT